MGILLLMTPDTYRATDFIEAARRLELEVVVGSSAPLASAPLNPDGYLVLPLVDADAAAQAVVDWPGRTRLSAVLAVDDAGTLAAAAIAESLQLPHNSLASARASRNKLRTRAALSSAGLAQPWFVALDGLAQLAELGSSVSFPCVVKPVGLSASRGVMRADDPRALERAVARLEVLLSDPETAERNASLDGPPMMIEGFVSGEEVAVEAVLEEGQLEQLAVFDKPDPLEGPYFEETLYVTPSRKDAETISALEHAVAHGAAALGLERGPLHAEARVHEGVVTLLELAPRTIGGLCSRALRFGTGMTLEELVLRQAAGLDMPRHDRELAAAGVMMVPIPKAGVLRAVQGVAEAEQVEHVEGFTQTIAVGQPVVPLPEGRHYLGFLYARAQDPETVENALRAAHAHLAFEIE